MLGAIIGDIIGSVYEVQPIKHKDFELFPRGSGFTDDTALTVAVAEHLLTGNDLVSLFHTYFQKYPHVGYGQTFGKWAKVKDRDPYNSWGNGSAMRVSPVAWVYDDKETVIRRAAETSAVTHDHPDAVIAAQAVALAIFMARTGSTKAEIRDAVIALSGYNLGRTLEEIRPAYKFHVYAIYSVPEAIIAFLESDSYEDAIRNAVSLGGDADTQACIAGSIAEAFYGEIPSAFSVKAFDYLDNSLRTVVSEFIEKFVAPKMKSTGPAIAKRDSWKWTPLPQQRITLEYYLSLPKCTYPNLVAGFVPQEMEDRWFIFYEHNTLRMIRSWTGFTIFECQINELEESYDMVSLLVNRDQGQYTNIDEENDRETVSDLINMFFKVEHCE